MEQKKDRYFEYMNSQTERYEHELDEFNAKINELLKDPVDTMGIILKCNLIIEHYIDEYLETAYPTIDFKLKDRLTYNQKIEISNNSRMAVSIFINGIKE